MWKIGTAMQFEMQACSTWRDIDFVSTRDLPRDVEALMQGTNLYGS